jgi:aminoglycoside phosphotransferase (APT) family kinase protein
MCSPGAERSTSTIAKRWPGEPVSTTSLLDTVQVVPYLRGVGVLPADTPAEVEVLSGGVSSAVFRVDCADLSVVVKQALPQLRVSDEWLSRVERSATEARAAAVLSRLLPDGSVLPPLYVDSARSLFVMPSAPRRAETWKARLMRGELEYATAHRVGDLLGILHRRSRTGPALRGEFADRQDFVALRVEPYLSVTAERRPKLAVAIGLHARRMLSVTDCLVHGDYSPKNLLVGPDRAEHVVLLDHEVSHWGDPAFDTAFCLTHLHLKACTFPSRARDFLDLAELFWRSYLAAAATLDPVALERDTVGLLGCLLAARVDGKSPAEYLTTDVLRERVRNLATTILLDPLASLRLVRDATLELTGAAIPST